MIHILLPLRTKRSPFLSARVRIDTKEGPAEVPLAEIARAKLLLTDELIAATKAEEKAAATAN